MIQDKLNINYAVKSNGNYKEVDMSKRIVDLVANTYNYFDADGDVLLMGCCSKSIQERGPQSSTAGKIKHLLWHDTSKIIARPVEITEEKFQGAEVLRGQSYFPESEESENVLINYQEGLYDQHSIGFRYINLVLAEKESKDENARREWDDNIERVMNADEADKMGFMFLVKEIALFEYSTVAFGANRLTPYLGAKSDNKQVRYSNLIAKLDTILKAQKSTEIDKWTLEMQERQLKQMIYELLTVEPFTKPTPQGRVEKTLDVANYINTNLKIQM